MTAPYRRQTQDVTVGDHHRRIRALEARPPAAVGQVHYSPEWFIYTEGVGHVDPTGYSYFPVTDTITVASGLLYFDISFFAIGGWNAGSGDPAAGTAAVYHFEWGATDLFTGETTPSLFSLDQQPGGYSYDISASATRVPVYVDWYGVRSFKLQLANSTFVGDGNPYTWATFDAIAKCYFWALT